MKRRGEGSAFACAGSDNELEDAGASDEEGTAPWSDLETVCSLERRHLSNASCIQERYIATFAISAARDLGRLEAAIRSEQVF